MAKPPKPLQSVVTCEVCRKQILPDGNAPIPTAYVWYEGRNYCLDCVHSGKMNLPKTETR